MRAGWTEWIYADAETGEVIGNLTAVAKRFGPDASRRAVLYGEMLTPAGRAVLEEVG